ncbi:MAG: hypothetical protein FJX77_02285, partial [Armatimonadetes bacterium]|nr:hypothetical protein [Armatimonadota bacterium]
GLVQLRLEAPTMAAKGDRYVLRFYSPLETIGGGAIVEPSPPRHRRFDAAVLANLAVKEQGTPIELVAEAVQRHQLTPVAPPVLAQELSLPVEEVRALVRALTEQGELAAFEGGGVLHRHRIEAAGHQIRRTLAEHHSARPMWSGMSREELRSRLLRQMDARAFALMMTRLEQDDEIGVAGGRVRLASHEPRFTEEQQQIVRALEDGLLEDPFNPPSLPDLCTRRAVPVRGREEVWEALLENGTVVRIAAEVFLHRNAVGEARDRVRQYLQEHGQITAAQFRDLLGTSRKYAVPLMEFLDAQRVTRRIGDVRELF